MEDRSWLKYNGAGDSGEDGSRSDGVGDNHEESVLM